MFRNNTRSQTQTQTQTVDSSTSASGTSNAFAGSFSTLNASSSSSSSSSDDEVIFAIVTGNLTTVRRLVNSSNANKVIDGKNKFTALHHAVRIKKNDAMIKYLMSVGANPNIKEIEGKDCIDLSIDASNRFLIDELLKKNEHEMDGVYTKLDDLSYKVRNLERSNKEIVEKNNYLTKTNEQHIVKIEELKKDNVNLKRKFDASEEAFANLLKKTAKDKK